MLSLLPLLVQLAGTYGPTLTNLLLGPKAGAVVATATKVATDVFGTTDPDAISAAVANNPELAKVYVAQIESATTQYHDALLDVQSARAQTVSLVQSGSIISWGAPIISLVIVTGFICLLVTWLFFPPSSDPGLLAVLNIMIGTLASAFGAVVQYWLGSSQQLLRAFSQPEQSPRQTCRIITLT